MFHRSYTKSSNVQLGLWAKNNFVFRNSVWISLQKISSEKALSQFIKQKENFVELVEINLGVDPENNKQDTKM